MASFANLCCKAKVSVKETYIEKHIKIYHQHYEPVLQMFIMSLFQVHKEKLIFVSIKTPKQITELCEDIRLTKTSLQNEKCL